MPLTVNYTFIVQTDGGFYPTMGYMNVILKAPGLANNVSMGATPYRLAPFIRYVSVVQSNIPAPKLNGAVFQWTYQSGDSRSIVVTDIQVIPEYLKEPFKSQFTKTFCTSLDSIAAGSPRTMYKC